MGVIGHIAKREVITRGRSRGFQVTLLILFLGVIAAGILPRLLTGDPEAREVTIGVAGDAIALTPALEVGDEDLAPTVITVEQDAVMLLEEGEIDVLFDGSSLTWDGFPDLDIEAYVRDVARQVGFGERAAELGLSQTDIATLFTEDEIEEVRLDGGDDEFAARAAVAAVSAFSIFLLLQVWGTFMTMGVIEEKSSRVVEILLSHVRPTTLLGGKLIGLGVLAVLQMLILTLGVIVALLFTDGLTVPSGVWSAVPLMLLTFVFGFGFYATGFAAAGSMVPRVEDAQATQFVMMLPLVAGYIIAATSFTVPDNVIVTIASFVPFTAPVIVPFRAALVDPPLWQPILSLAILAASTLVMLRVAGAIYRYSLLRTGSRVGFGEAFANRAKAEI